MALPVPSIVILFIVNGDFNYSVFFVLEYSIRLVYTAQREAMCDEWSSVNLALLYELQHLLAVASVYASCLERKVLAIHVGQWQDLRLVV